MTKKSIIEKATVRDVVDFLVGDKKGVVEGISVTVRFRAAEVVMNMHTCLSPRNTAFVKFLKSKGKEER